MNSKPCRVYAVPTLALTSKLPDMIDRRRELYQQNPAQSDWQESESRGPAEIP